MTTVSSQAVPGLPLSVTPIEHVESPSVIRKKIKKLEEEIAGYMEVIALGSRQGKRDGAGINLFKLAADKNSSALLQARVMLSDLNIQLEKSEAQVGIMEEDRADSGTIFK